MALPPADLDLEPLGKPPCEIGECSDLLVNLRLGELRERTYDLSSVFVYRRNRLNERVYVFVRIKRAQQPVNLFAKGNHEPYFLNKLTRLGICGHKGSAIGRKVCVGEVSKCVSEI